MFEMGVRVQVLKRGTLFAVRAAKLYDFYKLHESLDEIPAAERAKLETQVFRRKIDEIWAETVAFFQQREPPQIERDQPRPQAQDGARLPLLSGLVLALVQFR